MKIVELEVEGREAYGSSNGRRVRRGGKVPFVVVSKGEDSVTGSIIHKDFVAVARRSKPSQIFQFKSDMDALHGKTALVRHIQKDYVKNVVLHVDFQEIKKGHEVSLTVALNLIGEPVGVKQDGGVLTQLVHEVSVRCLPRNIPEGIDVDISGVRVGESIHARDLTLPEGVALEVDGDETLVSVVAPKVVEESETTEEGEEGAEGEASADAAAGEEKKPEDGNS